MKARKILLQIITLLMMICISGCRHKDPKDTRLTTYNQIVANLANATTYDDVTDFTCRCTFTQIDNYYLYNLVIDQPKIPMYDIVLVAYAADTIDEIHPSLGIFDEDNYALVPGHIDRQNGFYKGIALNGRIQKVEKIKCYISYAGDAKGNDITEQIFEVSYENR